MNHKDFAQVDIGEDQLFTSQLVWLCYLQADEHQLVLDEPNADSRFKPLS